MKYRIVIWHRWGPSVCKDRWYETAAEAELQLLQHGLVGWVQRFRDGKNRVDASFQVGVFE